MADHKATAPSLSAAVAAHRDGRYDVAKDGYRRVLAQTPGNVTALANLGVLLVESGDIGAGRNALEEAAAQPGAGADTWANLASARRAGGAAEAALAAANEALARQPDLPAGLYNRALAARMAGDPATAAGDLDKLLAARGDNPALLYERARVHLAAGEPAAAAAVLDRAGQIRPGEPAIALLAAAAHNDAGAPAAALAALEAVATHSGTDPEWLYQQGRALIAQGDEGGAEQALRHALQQMPDLARVANALAGILFRRNSLHEAEAVLRDALARQPKDAATGDMARLWNSLAAIYQAQDRIPEATRALAAALRIAPDMAKSRATYLLWLHYDPATDKDTLFQAHRAWADRFFGALEAAHAPPRPGPAEKAPLVVGIVGTKFRRHPQLWLYLRAFEALDPAAVHLVVYDATARPDDFTQRLRAAAALWRDASALDDAALARQMRADGLDILLHKAGPMEGRPGVVARRPAPVQVQWGGFNTMGMTSLDWFLGDWRALPPGEEAWFTEKLYRLPDGYVVYAAPAEAPPVGPLPAQANGYITFGCFNQPAKLNPAIAAVWAELLAAVPDSRLALRGKLFDDARAREPMLAMLAEAGIDRRRLVLAGLQPWHAAMAGYNQVDIALDPWPYSGGLTTIEALWMGVPTVTLPGPSFSGRHAATHLANAGLGDWIVSNTQEYVARARSWAEAPEALAELRAGLRQQVAASPLCDGSRFARNLESALRDMYCRTAQRAQHGE